MVLDWITQNLNEIWLIASSVITVASIIVKLTPSKKDDNILAKIINVFKVIALNPKNKK